MKTKIQSTVLAVVLNPASIKYVLREIRQVRGLMSLVMKPRNKQRWTPEDRAELRAHLRRLTNISSYLIVLAIPGSLLLLPPLGWWLDWRRSQRRPGLAETRPQGLE